MPRKLSTKEFIEKAKEAHGDFYDYSLVEYKNSKEKIKIICPVHGIFEQTPSDHLSGKGCKRCSLDKRRLNKKELIEKFKEIHSNKYQYKDFDYENNKTKVEIICPTHGKFEQTILSHLRGHGCEKCSQDRQRLTKKDFINKAQKVHGNKYDYSLTEYKNSKEKIKIICPEHGEFWQIANEHLKGRGCEKCSNDNRKSTDFIERAREIHGCAYDYSLVEYYNSKSKVIIICPEHGKFQQRPNTHLIGHGCPLCNESQGEKKIRVFLNKNEIHFIAQKTFDGCVGVIRKLPFDFYLPEQNILIEFDGRQHFEVDEYFGGTEDFNKLRINDEIKNEFAERNEIPLLRIPYWEIDNIENILEGAIHQ